MRFSLPAARGLVSRAPNGRWTRLEGQTAVKWGVPPESKGAPSAKPPKKPNHAPLLPKTSGCREPKKTTQKQLKWPRRDSNPGRGRSTPRPFFARPKPHHPSMRLGGRALESVLFMPENEEATPPIWVQGRRGCTLAKDHKKCGLLIIQYAVFATFASRARTEAPKGPFPTS